MINRLVSIMKYNLEDCIDFPEMTTYLLGTWEHRIRTWEYTIIKYTFAAVRKGLELVALVGIAVWGVATNLFWFHKIWWICTRALLTILVHFSPILLVISESLTWRKHQNDTDKNYTTIPSKFLVFMSNVWGFFSFCLFCTWLLTQQVK